MFITINKAPTSGVRMVVPGEQISGTNYYCTRDRLACILIARPEFRSKAYWLLGYAITGIYSDYTIAIGAIDRALEYNGELLGRFALPSAVNFVLESSGRVALVIAIWLFFLHVMRSNKRGAVSP